MKAAGLDNTRHGALSEIARLSNGGEDPLIDDMIGLPIMSKEDPEIADLILSEKAAREVVRWLWAQDLIVITTRGLPFRYAPSSTGAEKLVAIAGGESYDKQTGVLDELRREWGDLQIIPDPSLTKRVLAIPIDDELDIYEDSRWCYSTGVKRKATAEEIDRLLASVEEAAAAA